MAALCKVSTHLTLNSHKDKSYLVVITLMHHRSYNIVSTLAHHSKEFCTHPTSSPNSSAPP
jgi:hypothetical protein